MTSAAATPGIHALSDPHTGQRWAYSLVLTLTGIALGVSGMPAPLYGIYQSEWHLTPLTTTVIFAVYAFAALAAVLVSGTISDAVGRKPVLLAATATLVVGLVIFLFATNVWMLLAARVLHGAAVGSIVVAGAAALMDLRPDHGRRTGQLSGAAFNIGITVAILASSLLAQYAPHPLRLPFVVIGALVVAMGIGLLALRETHAAPTRGAIRIARPSVPAEIRVDFWFAALGVMAAWSVLGVLLSLFPTLAAQKTGVHNLVFGGAVVAVSALAAALVQLAATDLEARRSALVGDVGMAASLLLTIPALASHDPYAVFVISAVLGGAFGLSFGGSLRHLSNVVPAGRRGETMSAYYLLAYSTMAFPTIGAGWAATTWGLDAIYPWFAGLAAVACLAAGWLGLRPGR
ncbi:MFS transporter [Nocardioides jiangxiensis]|uniref:MFS transporter n=1 Tax=Nocardioides jiangxiensis TaxID=3064524 RepID=A0ABT9B5M3_9ACTN|nr:MFS transporter [Nocardioides sp. WY-20]MDO7868428.1 MFS transporter [Nocardioides sp. WY-20]